MQKPMPFLRLKWRSLGLLMVISFLMTQPALAAILKPTAQINGSQITLGDVLIDAGGAADIIIAAAPSPGDSLPLSLSMVRRAAAPHGVEVEATTPTGRVLVTRLARRVAAYELSRAIEERLIDSGFGGDMEVTLHSRRDLVLPTDRSPADISLEGLMLDDRSGRFTITAIVPNGQGGVIRQSINGQAIKMVSVPVLSQSLSRGDVIQQRHIGWQRLRSNRVTSNIIDHTDDLIGMAVRRPLRADTPLRSSDVEEPVLVEKNSLVTMTVKTDKLALTAMGKALENGGQGDVIRLVNIASHRNVDAIVTGPGEVTIISRLALQTAAR